MLAATFAAVGARNRSAVTDNLNFGNPGTAGDHGARSFPLHPRASAKPAGRSTSPVVSGNVSLYNETNGQAILPTPAIGARRACSTDLDRAWRRIALKTRTATRSCCSAQVRERHLWQSIYLPIMCWAAKTATPPPVDLDRERKAWRISCGERIADGRHDAPAHDHIRRRAGHRRLAEMALSQRGRVAAFRVSALIPREERSRITPSGCSARTRPGIY